VTRLPIALLLAPTFRSRAYAQVLVASGLAPEVVLGLPGGEPSWSGAPVVRVEGLGSATGAPVEFRPGEPARTTLAGIPWVELPNHDIHQTWTRDRLVSESADVIVYSGMPGVILRPDLLSSGRRFLHVHGGVVPEYRGSTTFYYSLLRDGTMGVSALWLTKEVDAGPILMQRTYVPPAGHEIDRVVDPLARAVLLVDVLTAFRDSGSFPGPVVPDREGSRAGSREGSEGEAYHVIHPVLKHLALRRCGLVPAPAHEARH
jgi:methionyl-tRNA formyltransferase